MRLAQIQMQVTDNKTLNLWHAAELIQQTEADMVILPEMFCCPYDNGCFRAYGEEEGGAAWDILSRTARDKGIWLVGGSLPELEGDRVYNKRSQVKRMVSISEGVTELVLREY